MVRTSDRNSGNMTKHDERADLDGEAYETVQLQIAARGADLWLALEAAQYARMLIREEPVSSQQADVVDAFAQAFSGYTENWEDNTAQNSSAVLEALGAHLDALRGQGLQVHWAIVQHSYETEDADITTIPLAIISVTPDLSPTIHLAMPDNLDISDED